VGILVTTERIKEGRTKYFTFSC